MEKSLKIVFIALLVGCLNKVYSQPIEGTTGLMKIPSAEMQADGTFIVGANYLPDAITPVYYNYNTENYFLNITFLPFLEFTYRVITMQGLSVQALTFCFSNTYTCLVWHTT